MTSRTFKQFGQAYGSTPSVITATINGTEVFSGEVSTVDTPLPVLPDASVTGTELFSWTNTVDFVGTQSFSVSVTGCQLLLTNTFADYIKGNNISELGCFYFINNDGITMGDPLSNVAIDGISMQRGSDSINLPGQWYWTIPAGSTLTATLNVNWGFEPLPA